MTSSLLLLVSASLAATAQVPLRSYLLALEEVTALANAPSHPICEGVFHSCMSSTACDSGTVCSIADKNTPCCTSAENSACPSPQSMGITCSKTRATNWCSSNSDCGMGVCCATGCGYNVCWTEAKQGGIGLVAAAPRLVFHSYHDDTKPECPNPDDVPVTCTAQRPMDWCLRHDECPSTPSNRRLCCLTQCGHHVCMRRTGAGAWIIA
ncbi:hypothetical protein PRIPAC_72128 [Pristionchus pacificus]|uniref:Uncharacterized protein n=1 Tax=Pristionchus pacificus TaxID=54126 RepID=A0A2A6C0Y3_PRIPA|nr:hypothetical protein PRIPAC_72128 [Pristionchus pacificus]|eukprot:PDM71834.1 hypothetical protein PRIPAC_38241 [Pristionchus pacificus]